MTGKTNENGHAFHHAHACIGPGEGLLPYARLLAVCAMVLGMPPAQAWRSPAREILLLVWALTGHGLTARPERASLESLMRQFPDTRPSAANGARTTSRGEP